MRRALPLLISLNLLGLAANAGATAIVVDSSSTGANVTSGCALRDAIEAVNTRLPVGKCPAGSGPIDSISIAIDALAFSEIDANSIDAVLPTLKAGRYLNLYGKPQTRTALSVTASCAQFLGYAGRFLEIEAGAAIYVADVDFANGCPDPADALAGAGGAIANYGSLFLTRSRLYRNSTLLPGFISSPTYYPGAAVYNGPDATFTASYATFDSNQGGGAVYVDSDPNNGYAEIDAWTFVGNIGSAIENHGAAVVANTTFVNNSGLVEGVFGPVVGGAIANFPGSSLELSYATLLDNPDPQNAILSTFSELYFTAGSTGWIESTLFATAASQSTANCAIDANASVYWYGLDISNDPTCGSALQADPKVDATLADNGGPTQTLKLLAGSAAFHADAGCTDAFADPVAADQRSYARPTRHCDAGAYDDTLFYHGFED